MAYEACPTPSEDCPYFNRRAPGRLRKTQKIGCYSDEDHIVPQRLARRKGATRLERKYVQSSVNKQQLCRWEHDEKTAMGDEPMPSVRDMLLALGELTIEGEQGGQAA